MKNKLFKAKMATAFSALILLVSFVALFLVNNGTLAWFSLNKSTGVKGLEIDFQDSYGKLASAPEYFIISAVKLDSSTRENIYEFSSTPVANKSEIKLETLSPIVAERQLLIKLKLNDAATTISIVAETTAEKYITNMTSPLAKADGNPLSSIIQFQVVTDITSSNGMYTIKASELSEAVHFADVNLSGTTLTVGDFARSIDVYSTAENDTDNEIFILLDYYETSADYVLEYVNNLLLSQTPDNPLTEIQTGENVNFVCDFVFYIS